MVGHDLNNPIFSQFVGIIHDKEILAGAACECRHAVQHTARMLSQRSSRSRGYLQDISGEKAESSALILRFGVERDLARLCRTIAV